MSVSGIQLIFLPCTGTLATKHNAFVSRASAGKIEHGAFQKNAHAVMHSLNTISIATLMSHSCENSSTFWGRSGRIFPYSMLFRRGLDVQRDEYLCLQYENYYISVNLGRIRRIYQCCLVQYKELNRTCSTWLSKLRISGSSANIRFAHYRFSSS